MTSFYNNNCRLLTNPTLLDRFDTLLVLDRQVKHEAGDLALLISAASA
jgi:hypothetical protein